MAVVKIKLEENEYDDDVRDLLIKALSNEVDFEEKRYDDPLMNEFVNLIDSEYKNMYSNLIQDIINILK